MFEGDAERVMTTWSFQTVVGGPFLLYLPPISFPSACSSAGRLSLLFSKGDGGEGRHSSNRPSAKEYLMIQNKGEREFSLIVQFYPDI